MNKCVNRNFLKDRKMNKFLVQTRFYGGWKHHRKISDFKFFCGVWKPNSTPRRSVFVINATTSFHLSHLLCEWRSQIEYLFDVHFLLVLGLKYVDSVRMSLRPCLSLCICAVYSRKHVQVRIPQGGTQDPGYLLTPYLNLSLQLIFISTLEITRDTKSITWVRCASGNALFQYASDKICFKSLVRWRHSRWSQIWPMNSFICIFFQFWSPGAGCCIGCKFGH